jgi:hypothetical protein
MQSLGARQNLGTDLSYTKVGDPSIKSMFDDVDDA